MLGNCSPASTSTMRPPPKPVVIETMPDNSALIDNDGGKKGRSAFVVLPRLFCKQTTTGYDL